MSLEPGAVVTIIHEGEPVRARVGNVRESTHGVSYAMYVDIAPNAGSRLDSIRGADEEGVTWLRGHDEAICAELRAAFNLSNEPPA